jgi:peptidoglycan/LPS O-acetylase OafA/YrhL
MNTERKYFASIELLRFVCAFLIIIFHAFYGWKNNYNYPDVITNFQGELTSAGILIDNAIHNLNLCVDVFFLISGFVITHILLSEKEKKGSINLKKFFISRVFRILPLYYFALALTPIYNYFFHEPEPDYLKFIFGMGNFEIIKAWSAATVNPMWTLGIELQFYVAIALAIAFIPRQHLYKFFTFFILCCIVYRVSIFHSDNWWMKVYMHTLSRADVIAFGCIIALYYHNNPDFKMQIPLYVRVVIYCCFAYVYVHEDNGVIDSIFLVSVKKYFYSSVIIFGFLNYLFNPNALFTITDDSPLKKLGNLSYGIYLFNILAVSLVIKFFQEYKYDNMIIFYVAVMFLTLIITLISRNLIEKPFLKLKENYF